MKYELRPADLLRKADSCAAAANRCRILGNYAMADAWLGKALVLRRKAADYGRRLEREQRIMDKRRVEG